MSVPNFDPVYKGCPHAEPDVGLFFLSAPVKGVRVAKIARTTPERGQKCIFVGEGGHRNDAGVIEFLEKRSTAVRIRSVVDSAVWQTNVRRGVPSPGDSGGPLFCDGVIVGTDSCGDYKPIQNGDATDFDRFDQLNQAYGRVDKAAAWIDDQITQWNASKPKAQ